MQFVKELTNAFQPYNAPRDALEHLTNIKMGNNMIEDHTAWFQTLLEKSGVSKNSPLAIDYYQKTLNVPLQKKNSGITSHAKNVGRMVCVKVSVWTSLYKVHKLESVQRVPEVSSKRLYWLYQR